MPTESIPYSETGYFSPLMCDYLAEKSTLKPFYNRFPKLENFEAQIQEKQQSHQVNLSSRLLLGMSLMRQYSNVNISQATKENIVKLKNENTFTITTGHN